MSKRWGVPLSGLVLLGCLCVGCLWWATERPRFTQTFDRGGGRTLTVWSIRRDALLDFGPNPLTVYYRVDAGPRELVPSTFLDHDDGGEYEFRVVRADGGRLACVYEVTRASNNSFLLLIYDVETGKSWPRTWAEEGGLFQEIAAKWHERYARLKAEHPGLPSPPSLVK